VRREAIHAAAEALDADDLEPLLEAARLDPDSLNRSLAARAAGGIGGSRAVQALWDRWARAEEDQRIGIVDAWSAPNAFRAGGQDKLMRVVESTVGLPRVAAAAALVRQPATDTGVALGVLIAAIREGSEQEQKLALSAARLDEPGVLAAVKQAATHDNGRVRMQALTKLARASIDRDRALKNLRSIAQREDDLGREARRELARLGDASVTRALTQELSARSPRVRATAARALLDLERYAEAASVLGDDSPSVRTELACAVLAKAQ
jgi:HEAT repeat protein